MYLFHRESSVMELFFFKYLFMACSVAHKQDFRPSTFTFQSLKICYIVKMWISLLFFLLLSCQASQARPQDQDYGSYGEEYFYQEYDEDYDMYYNYNYDGLEEETDEDPYIRNTTPSTTTTTTTTTTTRRRRPTSPRRPYYYTTTPR